MKRFLTMGIASLLALTMMAGCTSAMAVSEGTNSVTFDFEKDDAGFTPIYADYPASEGAEEFYELQHDYGKVPIDGAGNGIFISGNNHSDDLFMGYVKALEGFAPARTYHFTASFKLATDVEGGLVGVGGAPGESVAVKCGITQTEPTALPMEHGGVVYYRLNIDAGRQGNGVPCPQAGVAGQDCGGAAGRPPEFLHHRPRLRRGFHADILLARRGQPRRYPPVSTCPCSRQNQRGNRCPV